MYITSLTVQNIVLMVYEAKDNAHAIRICCDRAPDYIHRTLTDDEVTQLINTNILHTMESITFQVQTILPLSYVEDMLKIK